MGVLMGAALVACDDYKEPNPPAQYNPQGPVFQIDDLTVVDMISPSAQYDLGALQEAGENIIVATLAAQNLAEGYKLGAEVEISADDFETSYPVASTMTEFYDEEGNQAYNLTVTPQAIQDAYLLVTMNPAPAEIAIRYLLTVSSDDMTGYVGGPDSYYTQVMNIIPMPSDYVIEDAYYLIGTIDDWSVTGAIKFDHSAVNVYDDPVFTITINITPEQAEAGWWWKIIPQSVYESGEWGSADYSQFGTAVDGDSAASGKLVPRLDGKDPGAGDFQEAGAWKLTINMMELTYEFTSAVESLWVVGSANDWNVNTGQELVTSDYVTYTGFANLGDEFKFLTAPTWDEPAYGAGEEAGEISTTGGNLTCEAPGLYWVSVNTTELTYKTTMISSVSMIGGFNDWGGDVEMTSADHLVWTGTLNLSADSEWKFRMNNGWDINLGASGDVEPVELTPGTPYSGLVTNGKNLKLAAGNYTVTLDLSKVPYSCTVVAK